MILSKWKRSAAAFLIAGLALSLAACGANNSSNGGTPSATSGTSTPSSSPEPADPMGKYDPGIELTSVKYTLSGWTYPEGDSVENNLYTREIESRLGIKISYDWTVDTAQYGNKLNLSIASGDIPDFFATPDSKTFISLAKSGQLADLTEIYETYASDVMKEVTAAFPEGMESAVYDGKLLALPNLGSGIIASPHLVWIRDDWMTQYNLSAPESMEDVVNIARTFMENNPGTYGIGLEKSLYSGGIANITGFANAYHAYPTIWLRDEGNEIVYGSIQPEMKAVLQELQNLYKEGVFSKEFGIKDTNKVNEDLLSGKVGIEFGACWNSYFPFTDAVRNDGNAIWKSYALPSSDGQPVKGQATWPVSQYFVVNKNCKNPEAIIKLANFYLDFEATLDPSKTNNLDWQNAPVFFNDSRADYLMGANLEEALKTGDTSKLSISQKIQYDIVITWEKDKNPEGYGSYFHKKSLATLKTFVDEDRILLTQLRGPVPDLYSEKKATLDKLELDAFTKIIMGDPIDTFDQFVADWKKLGGDEVTAEINSVYK